MDLLGIASTSLTALNAALDTSAHNVTNANTPGYSREVARLKTQQPQLSGDHYLGRGVELGSVSRMADAVVNTSVVNCTTQEAYYQLYNEYGERISRLLSDETSSLGRGIQNFFDALQTSNQQALDPVRRLQILSNGQALVDRFKNLEQQLQTEINHLNQQTEQVVQSINVLGASVIKATEALFSVPTGNPPNDVLDTLDQLVRELGTYVNVVRIPDNNGRESILIGQGQGLCVTGVQTRYAVERDVRDASAFNIVLQGTSQIVTEGFTGGQIGALRAVRSEIITPALNALGRLALTFADAFNQQHALGMDMNGQTGLNFFQDINDPMAQLKRASAALNNTGSGVLKVEINPITSMRPDQRVISDPGGLVNSGTAMALSGVGTLSLNGVFVRPTLPTDDVLSTTDQTASGIAISQAINASHAAHGLKAIPQTTVVNLGTFTSGAIGAGEFSINQQAIVPTRTDQAALLEAINQHTANTGVLATVGSHDQILLYASDGRNVQIQTNGNVASTADFSNFNLRDHTAKDRVQRSQIKLQGVSPFDPVSIGGTHPLGVGFAPSQAVTQGQHLTTSDYTLTRLGSTYALTRLSDRQVVAQGNSPHLSADGFTVDLVAGQVAEGDQYTLSPTSVKGVNFQMAIDKVEQIALASPLKAGPGIGGRSNVGTGQIRVTNRLHPDLKSSLKVIFLSPTQYQVYNADNDALIGPAQPYDPQALDNPVFPIASVASAVGAASPDTYDPGYRVSLSGSMEAGDGFFITGNSLLVADNSNGNHLAGIAQAALIEGRSTCAEGYNGLTSAVGSKTALSKRQLTAANALKKQSENLQASISGVNLDEEVVSILKLSQNYQASARLISIEKELFSALIAVVQ